MRSKIPLLIVVIALLILGLLVFFGIMSRFHEIAASLPRVIESELESRLQRQVHVGSVRVISLRTAVITNLTINDREEFGRKPFFFVPRAVVTFSTSGLLAGRPIAKSILSVTLANPRVTLVRNQAKVWNIEDLIRRPPTPPAIRFRGTVVLRSARVTVVDYQAKIGRLPESNSLTNVSGSLDFSPVHSFLVNIRGRGAAGRVSEVRASGSWAVDRPVTHLNLTIRGASARYWLDYFTNISAWSLDRGTFDSQAVLYQPRGKAIVARGTAVLHDSSVVSPYLRTALSPFSANVSFVGTNIRFTGTGLFGNSPARIQGRILGLSPAVLDLAVAADRVDFKTLQSAVKAIPPTPYIRWTAPGTISATVTGLAGSPLVDGILRAPSAVVHGTAVRAITARSYYKAGIIHVTSVTARAAGGEVSASGTIGIWPFRMQLSAAASKVRVAGTPIESANGSVEIANGRIMIQRLLINAVRGVITAQGEATLAGALNLGIKARDVDLLMLLHPLGYTQFTGVADFDGKLTGTTGNLILAGQVAARNGEFRGTRYDLAFGRLIATNTSLTLQDAVIRQAGAEIATTGTIAVARKVSPRFALQVSTTGVDLSQLVALLDVPMRAQGLSTANLRVQGTYPNPRVSGEVTVENGVIAGIPFDSARLEVETFEGRTMIRQLFAVRGASRLVGTGFIGPQGRVEVNVAGENLDLSLLNDALRPYAVLQGPATFTAQIRGTINRPTLTGTFQVSNPLVNRQQFESFAASVAWDGSILSMTDAALLGQGTTWSLPLVRFTPKATLLDFQGSVRAGSITRIVEILKNSPVLGLPQGAKLGEFLAASPTPFAGAVDGIISLSGKLGSLNGNASITATAVQMGSRVVDKVELQLVEQQSVLLLQRVAVTSPGVSLAATAQFVHGKPTEAAAIIENTRVADLLSVIRSATFLSALDYGSKIYQVARSLKPPVTGSLSAALSITDIQKGATGTLSLAGKGIAVSDQPLGDVAASARLAGGSVVVDRFAVAGPSGQASLTGTVSSEGQISFSGTGTQLSLAVIRPFVRDQTIAGTADFGFSVSGTMDNPTVQLAFSASKVSARQVSFDSISTDRLTIAGDRIASDRLEVRKNGGSIALSGSLPFSAGPPIIPKDQPIMISADIMDTNLAFAKSLPGLVESASGTLTAAINVTGTINRPIINGPISLSDGFLKLKGFESSLTGVTAGARFVDSVLSLDSLQGMSSLGGSFTGSGTVTMTSLTNGLVNLFFAADALRLSMKRIGGPGASAILTATGQLVVVDTLQAPVVQGTLVVSDGRIVVPAEFVPTSIVLPSLPISPQLAVTLNLARNVTVERGGLRAQVVGPVTLAGRVDKFIISGTVQIAGGSLRYPARTLELQRGGTASFLIQPPQPAVISIAVDATTTLSAISPLTGSVTRYRVTLSVTGPIGNLSIDVRTSPPGISELEALAAIFGGSALEALLSGQPLGSVFQDQLGQVLLGLALPGLFQPVQIGAILFTLEPGFEIPLQVSASAQLTDTLTLFYSRSVMGRIPLDTFGFTHTLSPQLALTIQFEGLNGVAQDTTTLIQYYKRF